MTGKIHSYVCKNCHNDTIDMWAPDWCVETQICFKCCMEQEEDCDECPKITEIYQ